MYGKCGFSEGSSHRRPGVRMLLLENGERVGAVSGGCVENEIERQAQSVFANGVPKVITYDGRFRLGCEGLLYILIEPFQWSTTLLQQCNAHIAARKPFTVNSYYQQDFQASEEFGSIVLFDDEMHAFRPDFKVDATTSVFTQTYQPPFRLVIFGAEHDTVALSNLAQQTGWEVTVMVHPKDEKTAKDFPAAKEIIQVHDDSVVTYIDENTAVLLMTHSYVKDLNYLLSLLKTNPMYFVLGPVKGEKSYLNN